MVHNFQMAHLVHIMKKREFYSRKWKIFRENSMQWNLATKQVDFTEFLRKIAIVNF